MAPYSVYSESNSRINIAWHDQMYNTCDENVQLQRTCLTIKLEADFEIIQCSDSAVINTVVFRSVKVISCWKGFHRSIYDWYGLLSWGRGGKAYLGVGIGYFGMFTVF